MQIDFDSCSDEWLCELSETSRLAEETLVLRYTRMVKAIARPLFLAGGDSEDLIQEGTMGLVKAVREYKPCRNASFKTYAQLCIRHRLYSAVKTAVSGKHTPLNDSVPLITNSFGDDPRYTLSPYVRRHPNPEELIINREEFDELIQELTVRLSGFESQVLGLFLEGLSYHEMADAVGKSPKSVDNAVQRIRRKIAQQLNKAETT